MHTMAQALAQCFTVMNPFNDVIALWVPFYRKETETQGG